MFSKRRVRRLSGAFFLFCAFPTLAAADPSIRKTYGYFRIGGDTAEELDSELEKRGPLTNATGHRHPGATQIKFGGDVTYLDKDGSCSVGGAKVTLKTHIILPRWNNRRRASADLRIIWDTLSKDIKRHEERHAEIARIHARRLERELLALRPDVNCDALEKRVAEVTQRVLESHDRDQYRFDRVESANFDERMTRLLKYNIQRRRK